MTPATITPLTWPPASHAPTRWFHHLLHVTADIHARLGNAHHDLTILRRDLDLPAPPADLHDQLRRIDQAAVDPHDHVHLHQLLIDHDLPEVSRHLDRFRYHQLDALAELRRLAEQARRGRLTPEQLPTALDRINISLTAAALALIDADHGLLTALDTLPTRGGDRYSQ
jgi:hypothetical protein